MPIQSNGTAPYAPPSTVIELITRYRDRGLAKPFDQDVLARAGVPNTLTARVLQTLKLLDLIDEGGNPTPQFDDLARARQDEFNEQFGSMIRAVYADVFAFADPSTDDPDRIRDAFRAYNPRGQQERMVTLFLGLCEFAGIIPQVPKRAPGPKKANGRPSKASSSRNARRGGTSKSRHRAAPPGQVGSQMSDSRFPMMASLIAELPEPGTPLTSGQRQRFTELFDTLLNFYFVDQVVLESAREEGIDQATSEPEGEPVS